MFCFFSFVTRFLVIIFGTLLPARNTHEALDKKEELSSWSKYWIVYGCLMAVEIVAETFFTWLPLYVETKLLMVLWLVISAPSASVWIFDVILNPLMGRYMHRLDDYMRCEKRHLIADALTYSTKLCTRCLDIVRPMVKGRWKKPVKTLEIDAPAVIETDEDDTMTLSTQQQSSIFYDPSADDEAHHVTLASSESCTQLLEASSKNLLPDLAMKNFDIPHRQPLPRPKRKSYIYDRLDDNDIPNQKEENGLINIEDLLQSERRAMELQEQPNLQRRDTRRRFH